MNFKQVRTKYFPRISIFKNVYDEDRLMSIHPEQCGRVIKLANIPKYCFEKLISVLENSKLEKIMLANCLTHPAHTLRVLQAIQRNVNLQKIHLDVQLNGCIEECIMLIVDLISKRVINSFEVPYNMTEESTEVLLEGIVRFGAKMKILNLCGSVLNEQSINYLKQLLTNGKISEILRLTNCKGVAESHLTTEDKKQLEIAAKNSTKFIGGLKMYWFEYVGHIDIDRYHGSKLEFLKINGVTFNRMTGRKETLARYLVRDVSNKVWQMVKPGSKRKQSMSHTDAKHQRIAEATERDLSDMLQSQTNINKPSTKNKNTPINYNKRRRGRSTYNRGGHWSHGSAQSSSGEDTKYTGYKSDPTGFHSTNNPFGRERYEECNTSFNKAFPFRNEGATIPEKSCHPPRQPYEYTRSFSSSQRREAGMSNRQQLPSDFGQLSTAYADHHGNSEATGGYVHRSTYQLRGNPIGMYPPRLPNPTSPNYSRSQSALQQQAGQLLSHTLRSPTDMHATRMPNSPSPDYSRMQLPIQNLRSPTDMHATRTLNPSSPDYSRMQLPILNLSSTDDMHAHRMPNSPSPDYSRMQAATKQQARQLPMQNLSNPIDMNATRTPNPSSLDYSGMQATTQQQARHLPLHNINNPIMYPPQMPNHPLLDYSQLQSATQQQAGRLPSHDLSNRSKLSPFDKLEIHHHHHYNIQQGYEDPADQNIDMNPFEEPAVIRPNYFSHPTNDNTGHVRSPEQDEIPHQGSLQPVADNEEGGDSDDSDDLVYY
ncbi:uncharacterized protein LOC120340401 [Styela clava]